MGNESKLLLNTSILYRSMQKFYDKRLSPFEIGSGQLPFLLLVYENEGISMQQLAQMGSFDKGTITRGIAKLEEQGYIKIQAKEEDKRIRQLYTSEKTKDIITNAYLIRRAWWEQVSDGLSQEEMDLFESLQEHIAENARKMVGEEESHTKIFGLQKLTLLDYPGKVACTLFSGGCNFRCPFCQNSDLVFLSENLSEIKEEDLLSFLRKRSPILEGVCVSGGEPLLQPDIETFLRNIKALGYAIKLDTNGSQPEKLKALVEQKLIDYVAMDIKNCKARYGETSGIENFDLTAIEESVAYLKTDAVPYEFRTTIVKEFHRVEDVEEMGKWLKGGRILYLQQFVDSERVIVPGLHAYGEAEMQQLAQIAQGYLPVQVRGI